jgi:hypothetical protein
MKKEEFGYLAQLEAFGYELTAIGRTREEALNAIKEAYERRQDKYGPLDDHGNMRSFEDYAEFAAMNVREMPFGEVWWI